LKNLSKYRFIICLFFLGISWTFISPISSAADDDYHLVSIWCADKPSEHCQQLNSEKVLVPSELNAGLIPEKFTGLPPCYVSWPVYVESAACLQSLAKSTVVTTRFSRDNNSVIYYWVLNKLVTSKAAPSVYFMRVFNLLICILFFCWCYSALDSHFAKLLRLTWTITLVPIGIFYLVSTNPSSWAITGIGIFWIVLLNILHRFKNLTRVSPNMLFLLVGSGLLAYLGRKDSIVYIGLVVVLITILNYKIFLINFDSSSRKYLTPKVNYFLISFMLVTFIGFYHFLNFKKLFDSKLIFPKASTTSNEPNALVNLFIELPSFVQGVLGGQQPNWTQHRGGLGRDFTYGAGWLEFSFPSAVGILLFLCVFSLSMKSLREASKIKFFTIIFSVLAVFSIMVISRGMWAFKEGTYFQPRYFAPLLISLIGITLYNENTVYSVINKIEKFTYGSIIIFATILAWLQTFSRYSLGPGVPFTNIGTQSDWWYFPENKHKLLFIFVSFAIHSIWVFEGLNNLDKIESKNKFGDRKYISSRRVQ
jgi:hypothetical protein